jgi:UDP-N-acetylglucosamine 3-dehydrogenase
MAVKIGVVGAGFISKAHLNAYAKMQGVEVRGVADLDPGSAAAGAAMVGAKPYASYEDLVAAEDVDAVDFCLPTFLHREAATKAARDGKHAILEKPIARTLEDAEAIIESFSGSEGRLFVGHVLRFFPEFVRIREMARDGDLGTVGVIRTTRRSPMLTGWGDWYADWGRSGGALVDLVIHDFDFLRWSFGEVERVYARGLGGREYNRLDYALTTLRFSGGEIAHVEAHWGYPGPFNFSIEVAGSDAMVTLDSRDPAPVTLAGGPVGGGESPDVATGKSPFQTELEHFLGCIESGGEPLVSGEDAYEALRIALAASESLSTGRPVTLGGGR